MLCVNECDYPLPYVTVACLLWFGSKNGWFDVEFAEKPDSSLQTECCICHLILHNPCETTCCGVYFCRACIERYQLQYNSCPHCRGGFPSGKRQRKLAWHESKAQERFINQLKVICKHNAEGCEWVGELRQLKGHLNENPLGDQDTGCEFVQLKCRRCNEDMKRADFGIHRKEKCLYRDVECPNREKGCIWFGQHESIAKHLNLDSKSGCYGGCGFVEVSCSFKCGQSTERRELKEHETACPFRLVDCEFKALGCSARVAHKDMQTHVSVDHMKMLLQACVSLQQTTKESKSKIENLKSRIGTLEGNSWNSKCKVETLRSSVQKMREQSAKQMKKQDRLVFAAAISALLVGALLAFLVCFFLFSHDSVAGSQTDASALLLTKDVSFFSWWCYDWFCCYSRLPCMWTKIPD